MNRNKYYLEIDASGFEAPCDEGQWLGYGLITAEGNSLQECLDSAQVDLIDQDGGEFDIREADSADMQDAVEKAFMAAYGPDCASDATSLNREYVAEKNAEADSLNKENSRG